jgi:hypothetical protein
MPQNFVACDREQDLLLPPSLREWLPQDHLAWLVLEAVGELDFSAFYRAYRDDGHGRAAHDLELTRFRGHLIAGPSGLAGRISVHAIESSAVFAGVPAAGRRAGALERGLDPADR